MLGARSEALLMSKGFVVEEVEASGAGSSRTFRMNRGTVRPSGWGVNAGDAGGQGENEK